ncbi:MAG: hypothetical protein ACK4YQ_04820 [Phenylobacterium sp.]|uniref:hypothetical protein n=1 Tax=Phenylobacterium sp. TaxID=1871053 RepID=UPI00391DE299
MIFRHPLRSKAAATEQTPWEISVDVDIQLALALSRASVNALLALSPHAAAVVRDALAREVDALQAQNDPPSLAAASSVLDLLRKAA